MKKFVWLLLLFVPCIVFASTNVKERTKDDLGIPSKVKYSDYMYSNVISTPYVDSNEKVYDFASLFGFEDEKSIYSSVSSFIENTSLDLAVVTINDNNKSSTMEYADDFYDYNDFKLDGLVYVIDMDNREFYISTSGKALLYYGSGRIENILSSMDDAMYEGRYFDSVKIMIDKLSYYYDLGYDSGSSNYVITGDGKIVRRTPYILFGFISFVISFVIVLIMSLRNKPVRLSKDSKLYLDKNGIVLTNKSDTFVNSHTSSHYSPVNNDSGGGHSSGGSSFHSGSSGISHGGGGHHF